jgi:hypothetical protein
MVTASESATALVNPLAKESGNLLAKAMERLVGQTLGLGVDRNVGREVLAIGPGKALGMASEWGRSLCGDRQGLGRVGPFGISCGIVSQLAHTLVCRCQALLRRSRAKSCRCYGNVFPALPASSTGQCAPVPGSDKHAYHHLAAVDRGLADPTKQLWGIRKSSRRLSVHTCLPIAIYEAGAVARDVIVGSWFGLAD